jgi:hypothetical protein
MNHKAIGIQKFIALSPFNLAGNGELLFLGGTMWLVLPSLNNKQEGLAKLHFTSTGCGQ